LICIDVVDTRHTFTQNGHDGGALERDCRLFQHRYEGFRDESRIKPFKGSHRAEPHLTVRRPQCLNRERAAVLSQQGRLGWNGEALGLR